MFISILNQAAITKYQRPGELDDKNLFLTVPATRKPKIKALAGPVSDKDSLPGLEMSSPGILTWRRIEREQVSSHRSLQIKTLIPFMRAQCS